MRSIEKDNNIQPAIDRFEKISNNYGELFKEVWLEMGLEYGKFERSVYEQVVSRVPDFRDKAILDIGVGDGLTSEPFIEADCKHLMGVDLNGKMLEETKKKFGDRIELVQADARDLPFESGAFSIIISAATIHNIKKEERAKVWGEIIRLKPEIFVCGDKIGNPNEEEHQREMTVEMEAIRKVYQEKHGLDEANETWQQHYRVDEQERLSQEEITASLCSDYDIEFTDKFGMYQTFIAKRKEDEKLSGEI